MTETIKFLKIRKVKSPSRANFYDAGIDFYVPEFTDEFLKDLEEKNKNLSSGEITNQNILLHSGQRILIPSGIKCQMANPGRALIAANKSGIASKTGLIFGAQVIDYEYQGEIHLNLIYTGSGIAEIIPGQKIIQFIETPVFNSIIEVIENQTSAEFYRMKTGRGEGGFGSSNKN